MSRIYILVGLSFCILSAIFMGAVIAWVFGISKGATMIVCGIVGFFGGAVCMSSPGWALSPDKK
jgi:hypothetical protein